MNLVDPSGEFVWGLAFAVIDIALQLYENDGNFRCVNWGEVGLSLLGGGLLNGLTKGAFIWRSARYSTKWAARRSWTIRNKIMTPKSGEHLHHWFMPQKYYRGNTKLEHIFNQPWNLNPIDGALNRRLGGGFWKTKLGAPSWAGETAGGAGLNIFGGNGGNCGCGR